jgi:hypothetical protein
VPNHWDPAWGTRQEFRARIEPFVEAFDGCAAKIGLDPAIGSAKAALRRTLHDQAGIEATEVRERELAVSARP